MSKLNVYKVLDGFECDYKDSIVDILYCDFDGQSLEDLIGFLSNRIDYRGALTEMIRSEIDIYYYDLRVWFMENYDYVDQAIKEFGKADDIHKDIQMGQYLQISEEVQECIDDMIEFIEEKYHV